MKSNDEGLRDILSLKLVAGIGPALHARLVSTFGSESAVLDARLEELRRVPRITDKLARSITEARGNVRIDQQVSLCRKYDIHLVQREQTSYPVSLQNIDQPPPLLFVRGGLESRDTLAIALVGSRRCSTYGIRQAERLATGLVNLGVTIVSGLARGIDAAAHRATLASGGRTIAVLASGLDHIYPPEHFELARDVAGHGALISEMPMGVRPRGTLFPQRNRIVSGMSLGVVVIEADERSGALITARHAMDQNREVMAVPGPVDGPASCGPHQLIRDGARLIESADDVIDTLGPLVEEIKVGKRVVRHPVELKLNPIEQMILDIVDDLPRSGDEVTVRSQQKAASIMSTLSVLEMKRLVRRLPGNMYVRR